MPTDRLLRIVESKDTSTHFVASARGVSRRDHPVDDRLAVLRLAGLEVRRVDSRLDEVALGIDPEQPQRLAADLPAHDERRVESDLVLLQVRAIPPLDVAHGVGDEHRDVEHRPRAPEVGRRVAGVAALIQHADHGLRSGEVAGAQEDDDAVAAPLEHRHLAEPGDVVHAGVGARVRRENHPRVEHHAYAIRHSPRPFLNPPPDSVPPP